MCVLREFGDENRKAPRSMQIALFAIGLLWLLAARSGAASAGQGIAHAVHADILAPLLNQIFLLILLVTGFTALNWVATRNGSVRATNALPWRATTGREWQKGVAFGWAMLLITVLPMAVVGDLHPQFLVTAQAWGEALLALAVLLVGALAAEMAWRGFLFRRLIEATGPVTATLVLSLVYAFFMTSPPSDTPFSFFVAFTGGVLFSVAYLRTHALWVGWGIRFGWLASMGVLFGLPLAGSADFASVVATDSSGRLWLTGGAYGPEGGVFTGLVLLAAAMALYPLTREYAWEYTQAPIIPRGYPMEVAPPAAHAAMEAAAGTKLVQILGSTSPAASTSGAELPSMTPVPGSMTSRNTDGIAEPGFEGSGSRGWRFG